MRTAIAMLAVVVAVTACGRDRAPAVIVVTAWSGGSAGAPDPAPRIDPALVAIRDAAHAVMSARCGACHESHRPTAKPAALAIFDLDRPDWPDRFDAARFAAGLGRFGGAPDADRRTFVAFRDAELARRAAL